MKDRENISGICAVAVWFLNEFGKRSQHLYFMHANRHMQAKNTQFVMSVTENFFSEYVDMNTKSPKSAIKSANQFESAHTIKKLYLIMKQ